MKTSVKVCMVAALAVAVGATLALKQRGTPSHQDKPQDLTLRPLPRLLDLGADKCVPCKLMAPILEELREEYAGVFEVVFIDVIQDPNVGKQYGLGLIPTQIFYDASGRELFRHEGFYGKQDILAKWKELGFAFENPSVQNF